VQSYREDNERIMKAHEEIIQSLNMLHKQDNKDSGTKQTTSATHVTTSDPKEKWMIMGMTGSQEAFSSIIIHQGNPPGEILQV
jgi:hypothetical protein